MDHIRPGEAHGARLPRSRPLPWLAAALRWLTVGGLAAAFLVYVAVSWRWRMMVDSPVMHYVVLLMRHGLRPYTDISDNNMPGSYLAEAAAMAVFGTGDAGWRLYEFSLLLVLGASFSYIARRVDWVAGLFAAGLFAIVHSAEGPQNAVERDLVLAVMLAVGYATLFAALRRREPGWLVGFGLCSAWAAAIKPTFLPLPLCLLALGIVLLLRRRTPLRPFIAAALAGAALTTAAVLLFLLRYHAFGGFLFILREVIPAYAGLQPVGWGTLLAAALPRPILVLAILALPLAIWNARHLHSWSLRVPRRMDARRTGAGWERIALALGAVFGLGSYLVQRKGFPYQRYELLAFLLLLISFELFTALQSRATPIRLLAAAAILFALGVVVPLSLRNTIRVVGHSDLELSLERDLNALGGATALQHRVMCFDMVYGCLDALGHLGIVENTGFTGDLLFFSPVETAPVRFYRRQFQADQRRDPAEVVVISNANFSGPNSFAKTRAWPGFDAWLEANYTLAVERHSPYEHLASHFRVPVEPGIDDAYRLYVRKGSTLERRP